MKEGEGCPHGKGKEKQGRMKGKYQEDAVPAVEGCQEDDVGAVGQVEPPTPGGRTSEGSGDRGSK